MSVARRASVSVCALLAAVALVAAAASPALGADVSLAPTTAARQHQQLRINESGSAAQSGYLSAFYERNASSCARLTRDESARRGSVRFALRYFNAGQFSFLDYFTPQHPGSYLLCAYLDYSANANSDTTPPDAFRSIRVDVAPSPARLTLSASTRSRSQRPVTIRERGSVAARSTLRVYYELNAARCAPSSLQQERRRSSRAVSPEVSTWPPLRSGTFDRTDTFTPQLGGTYLVCGYVDDDANDRSDVPNATASVRVPVAGARLLVGTTSEGRSARLVISRGAVSYRIPWVTGGACQPARYGRLLAGAASNAGKPVTIRRGGTFVDDATQAGPVTRTVERILGRGLVARLRTHVAGRFTAGNTRVSGSLSLVLNVTPRRSARRLVVCRRTVTFSAAL